ncbi:DVU_1557 family redox protein [Tepidibacter aestuarii]|uniref:DVU_1557 family redox protein n=1 Tax=Tepidibacter aestuarii TaxID=2925782 RepID=UPI0020BE7434|nr:CLJU_RS11820 family redox protein [Tepidibacter aestuarii]CAH2213315.1 DNA-binding protein [Tepidibacter aestuarii]
MDVNKENYDEEWVCQKCNCPVEEGSVKAIYLSGNFEVELLKCPICKNVLVTEDLAIGKMLEVEKGLEDK